METVSTTVPSITLPKIPPKSHHLHHLKPPFHHHNHHHISTTGKPPSSISTKSTHHTFNPTHLPPTPYLQPTPPPTTTHTHPATGYAAALVDSGLCSNSLEIIHKDVKKLLKWLKHNEMMKNMMGDVFVEEGLKGKVIREVAIKAKLTRHVVAVVKMLVAKNKSWMVSLVMEEFERIYCELNNTKRTGFQL